MSKRPSLGQTNTLFNYFQSPKRKIVEKQEDPPNLQKTPNKNGSPEGNKSLFTYKLSVKLIVIDLVIVIESDSEESIIVSQKKRSRIIADSDSDSDDKKSSSKNGKENGKNPKRARIRSTSDSSDDEKPQKNTFNVKSFSFSKDSETENKNNIENKINSAQAPQTPAKPAPVSTEGNWLHHKLEFLKPEKIRDINRNKPGHPDYDERTLYVPEEFLNKQTPAMRQWWILKSKHFDSVLFFKGKLRYFGVLSEKVLCGPITS